MHLKVVAHTDTHTERQTDRGGKIARQTARELLAKVLTENGSTHNTLVVPSRDEFYLCSASQKNVLAISQEAAPAPTAAGTAGSGAMAASAQIKLVN